MNKSEILAAVKKVPYAFVATVEGNEPRVRGLEIFRADENGLIFYTARRKEVCKQMMQNPNVEICVFDEKAGMQIRIRGTMEPLEDNNLKKEICTQRQFLKYLGENEEEVCDALALFRLSKGKAAVWTMAAVTSQTTFTDY